MQFEVAAVLVYMYIYIYILDSNFAFGTIAFGYTATRLAVPEKSSTSFAERELATRY